MWFQSLRKEIAEGFKGVGKTCHLIAMEAVYGIKCSI